MSVSVCMYLCVCTCVSMCVHETGVCVLYVSSTELLKQVLYFERLIWD